MSIGQKRFISVAFTVALFGVTSVYGQTKFEDCFVRDDKHVERARKINYESGAKRAIKYLDEEIPKLENPVESLRYRADLKSHPRGLDNPEEGLKDLDRAAEIAPDDPCIYYDRLKTRLKRKVVNKKLLVSDADMLKKLAPAWTNTYLLSGEVFERSKDYQKALSEYELGTSKLPESLSIRTRLYTLMFGLGRAKESVDQLGAFLDSEKARLGKFPKLTGVKVIKNSKLRSGFKRADGSVIPVSRHTIVTRQFQSTEARKRFEKQNYDAQEYSKLFTLLATFEYRLKQMDGAIKSLKSAVEIDRTNDIAFGFLGKIYLEKRKPSQAIDYLDSAISIADDPIFYFNRGLAYLLKDDKKRSDKDFGKYVKLYPSGAKKLDEMIAQFKSSVGMNP